MSNKKQKATGNWQRRALQVVCVVLAIILLLLIGATYFIERKFSMLNRPGTNESLSQEEIDSIKQQGETRDPNFSGVIVDPDDVTHPEGPADKIGANNRINILLVGEDCRSYESVGRSDATILCSLDKKNGELTMISFQRDMYLPIPGYFKHKFNTSYALGGFEVLDETLEHNFGVRIDGNVAVNFEKFIEIVDAVGGVDIELTDEEAEYMNTYDWDGLDDSGWALTGGVNHLNGDQTLAYTRIRGIDSDFQRNNRQRVVLESILNECKNLSVWELNDLLNTVLPMITTDISNADIISYAAEVFPLLPKLKVKMQQIPADDTWDLGWTEQDGGMSIVVYDAEANQKILADLLS